MENYSKKEIIERLEARTVSFKFPGHPLVLFIKGRADSKRNKVNNELYKYFAVFTKFVEGEYKNLIKEIHPSVIAIETAGERLRIAEDKLNKVEEPKTFDDPRKQKRELARANAARASAQAQYNAVRAELIDEKAFLDAALNVIVRLCLSAYEYTLISANDYLKYVSGEYSTDYEDITYETLYAKFSNAIAEVQKYENI